MTEEKLWCERNPARGAHPIGKPYYKVLVKTASKDFPEAYLYVCKECLEELKSGKAYISHEEVK